MKTPSPALIVASAALIVALAGTGVAITALPRNSVGTAQIRNRAITGAKIKPGSLTAALFAKGTSLGWPIGPQGAAGEKGATGPAGPRGPEGPSVSTSSSGVGSLPLTTNPAVVIDTEPFGRNITVTADSRLIVSAGLSVIGNATAWNAGVLVNCYSTVVNGDWHATMDGSGDAIGGLTGNAPGETSLAVVNSAEVPPGTYRVQVWCYTSSPVGSVSFDQGNETVVATAR